MTNEFQKKLERIYKDKDSLKRDIFGRRPATPREIQTAISIDDSNFVNLLEVYSPTQKDIDEKGD